LSFATDLSGEIHRTRQPAAIRFPLLPGLSKQNTQATTIRAECLIALLTVCSVEVEAGKWVEEALYWRIDSADPEQWIAECFRWRNRGIVTRLSFFLALPHLEQIQARGRANSMFHLTESETEMPKASN
jgi:hypothetical protein